MNRAWIAFGVIGVAVFVLSLIFVTPTVEARLVAATLFVWFALIYTTYSVMLWRSR